MGGRGQIGRDVWGQGGGWNRTCTVVQTATMQSRIIGLSGDLAFGNVATGQTKTAVMTITNRGAAPLTVTGIGYPDGFSGAWSEEVGAGESVPVEVTFAPMLAGAYGGVITVESDATEGTNTIAVSGTGFASVPEVAAGENFGVVSNLFGFTIQWASGQVVRVEANEDIATDGWHAIWTNMLEGDSVYFSDPQWTNFPGRYFRVTSPP